MGELKLSDITFAFGEKRALDRVSLTVRPGELMCLVGPSGSGKSTLLRLIAGLTRLQSGSIRLGKRVLADKTTHIPTQKRHVGLVFQHPSLFPHLNVRQNIAFGIRHLPREECEDAVTRLLRMINLEYCAERAPHTLSGGQQQRVALARALAPEPSVMLLDEPFANLDYRLRRDIAEEVIGLLKQANIPIMMVTHDPEEALVIADSMVLLSQHGEIKQTGAPDSLHNHPVDIETAAFFGPVNSIPAKIEGGQIVSMLGTLPADDYLKRHREGQQVVIITRPEGLRIQSGEAHCVNAKVTKTRHTGAGWLINAEVGNGLSVRFHHIYGDCPAVGEKVCISFQSPHVFVFEG